MANRLEWAKRVKEWKASGLTATAFGERAGTTPKKLYWWSWALRRGEKPADGARTMVSQKRKSQAARFFPVVVRAKSAKALATVSAGTSARVEIGFGNGCVLRTEPTVDARWLAEIIVAVDGARGC